MTNEIDIVRKEIADLRIHEDYAVADPAGAAGANESLAKIKSLGKQLDAAKKKDLAPIAEQEKEVRARYRPAEEVLIAAEQTLKRALLQWNQMERRAIEEDARRRQEAAAVERARLEEEARREREKAQAKADKLAAAGKAEQAAGVLAAADLRAGALEAVAVQVAAPAPVVAPTALEGASIRRQWKGKIVDLRAFLRALADSPFDPAEAVSVSPAWLNRMAGMMKEGMEKNLPGTIGWEEESISARAR